MAQLSLLLDRVFDELPAVPEALALRALSDAFREFCSRTHAWQGELPRVGLRPGKSTYDLYPDTGVQVVALKDVRLNGRRLRPADAASVRAVGTAPSNGRPVGYTQVTPTTLELTRPADEADRLTVRAALSLTLNSTTVDLPDTLVDEYGEAIAAGAKMRLVRQATQPWFAPDAAINYSVPFYSAVNNAKLRAMTAMGEAEMQIEMRGWA